MNTHVIPPPKSDSSPPKVLRRLWTFILWGLLPLGFGILVALSLINKPAVGLIHMEFDIWAGSADFLRSQIEEARSDPSIKAVVLLIDSPGGEVAPTQDMYLEILSLRQEMPVVGSVGSVAASGGYYISLATSPIYAKPNSTIGNIGVWGFVPSDIGVNEVVLASGPFKLTASNRSEFLRRIEGIKQEFLGTVVSNREDRLNVTPTELSKGLAYSGRQALEFGLVDDLGSQRDAIEAAAKLAGIAHYDVVDLQQRILEELLGEEASLLLRPGVMSPELEEKGIGEEKGVSLPWFLEPWVGAPDMLTGQRVLPPGIYLLYDMRLGGAK